MLIIRAENQLTIYLPANSTAQIIIENMKLHTINVLISLGTQKNRAENHFELPVSSKNARQTTLKNIKVHTITILSSHLTLNNVKIPNKTILNPMVI